MQEKPIFAAKLAELEKRGRKPLFLLPLNLEMNF